jgi:hypothetical protein
MAGEDNFIEHDDGLNDREHLSAAAEANGVRMIALAI